MSLSNGLKRQRTDPDDQPAKRIKPNATPSSFAAAVDGTAALSTFSDWVKPWGFFQQGADAFRRALNIGQPAAPNVPSTTASHLPTPGPSRPRTPASSKATTFIPSTFSPSHSSPSFRHRSTSQLREAYRTALDDWRWASIRARGGGGADQVVKPPQLVALEVELMNRKVKKEQEKEAGTKRTGAGTGAAAGANGTAGESGFRRKKPMGSEKNRQPSAALPPSVPLLDIDSLPSPSLRPARSRPPPPSPPLPPPPPPPRIPSPAIPAPSMFPKSPWAPAYDPATFSPPSSFLSSAPLSPRIRPSSSSALPPPPSNTLKHVSFAPSPPAAPVSLPSSSSRPERPSRKQHKSLLSQRDLATIAQLQDGASVINPLSPSNTPTLASSSSHSATLGAPSPPSPDRHPYADADEDELYLGGLVSSAALDGLRGQCVSAEERQRRLDMEVYRRKVAEGAERQEGGQAASGANVPISRHHSTASSRHRTTSSLVNPSTFFPEPSPFVPGARKSASSKGSKLPLPAGSASLRKSSFGSVDRALEVARRTMAEPLGRGAAFERYDAMKRAVEEAAKAAEEEEEEEVRQKRRVWPKKLSKEHLAIVNAAWSNPRFHSSMPAADVEARNLRRLKDGDWLDDEVINFHGKLINRRSDEADKTGERGEGERRLRKVFCFPTMFYNKLLEEKGDVDKGFNNVKRWTKKFDTFAKDIIIVPINQGGNHWVCAAVNLAKKRIEYYDSMGGPRPKLYA
ncbi:hypothetical protein JCM6882_001973, partial [Rhodosporidiobolus microsporus]